LSETVELVGDVLVDVGSVVSAAIEGPSVAATVTVGSTAAGSVGADGSCGETVSCCESWTGVAAGAAAIAGAMAGAITRDVVGGVAATGCTATGETAWGAGCCVEGVARAVTGSAGDQISPSVRGTCGVLALV
jgi:hypothetical protein